MGLARGNNALVGNAGIFADINASQDAQPQPDDIGLFVGEDGAPFVVLGNGASGDASAIDARVTGAGTLWTAEMSINLSSLGGVGHVIHTRLSHANVIVGGDTYAWPYVSQSTQPNTWGQTVLGNWPTLTAISPMNASVGSGDVVLTLDGTNFDAGTVALWNGGALNTTVVSATQMSAVVPAAKFTLAGLAKVQVVGAGLANAPSPASGLEFAVTNPTPNASALSPDTTKEGEQSLLMTVTGNNFAPGAVVLWDGLPLPTTVLNSTQVQIQIGTAQLQAGRVVQVAVQNVTPGGGPSNALVFVVSSQYAISLPLVRR